MYFQNQEWLDLALDPREGNVAVVRAGLVGLMYAGFIQQDPEGLPGELIGRMQDHFGQSVLAGIVISDQRMDFVKQYEKTHRIRAPIAYVFRMRDGNTWVGEYSGDKVGSGITRCVLTEVDETFFDSELLVKLLGRRDAHFWWPKTRGSKANT